MPAALFSMRTLIESLDSHFAYIDSRQRILLEKIPDEKLFWTPISTGDTLITLSIGGAVLRSAAKIEQAFLGLTRRLWDDPFEWTLPEKLSSKAAIIEYLDEVTATRKGGLLFLTSDADLSRLLPAPEDLKPILRVLVESIAHAENFLGRGEAVFRLISGQKSTAL
jgi:hypothetical protein